MKFCDLFHLCPPPYLISLFGIHFQHKIFISYSKSEKMGMINIKWEDKWFKYIQGLRKESRFYPLF